MKLTLEQVIDNYCEKYNLDHEEKVLLIGYINNTKQGEIANQLYRVETKDVRRRMLNKLEIKTQKGKSAGYSILVHFINNAI